MIKKYMELLLHSSILGLTNKEKRLLYTTITFFQAMRPEKSAKTMIARAY